ncbi:MAG: 16S rRNA (cytidine(1402)-2'-O)-methyltransferase [Deltaproteobacteria bacterium]|nr:16S rRNA (cytidine(1402)-2'-O)-methyltransferase [Deltaproteobacteria bacterium]
MYNLYIVATPIGNLEDITIRALKTLRSVSLIACEDTRKTRILTSRYHIKSRLISYHEYNKKGATENIVSHITKAGDAALVTEAGTPLISDPGSYLVRMCIERDIRVIPIPGPSSVIAALSASGADVSEFTFIGFLPKKPGKRKNMLLKLKEEGRTFVVFEAARDIEKLFDVIENIFGNIKICYAKEITKFFENIRTKDISSLRIDFNNSPELLKGEITLIISPKL